MHLFINKFIFFHLLVFRLSFRCKSLESFFQSSQCFIFFKKETQPKMQFPPPLSLSRVAPSSENPSGSNCSISQGKPSLRRIKGRIHRSKSLDSLDFCEFNVSIWLVLSLSPPGTDLCRATAGSQSVGRGGEPRRRLGQPD